LTVRVLIAWCNGGNWGHVSRQLALARHAQHVGAEVLWAVPARNADAMAAVRARGHRVLVQRAAGMTLPTQRGAPRSYAGILLRQGFGDAATLEAQTVPWLQLYEHVRPDRVLIDYAPAAQFAAQLTGLPTLQLTNGFDSPPADCPPYEAQVRGLYLWQQAATHAALVDQALQAVSGKLAPQRTDCGLQALIEYPHRLMDCVAQTDPYGDRRAPNDPRLTYVGALGEAPDAAPVHWPAAQASQRVFAYLRGRHPLAVTVLSALVQADSSVLCVWPDAPEDALARLAASARLIVTRRPVQALQALQQADAVVNYGSSTFVCQALLAGKPQLMLPNDHEKTMVATRVATAGLGWWCSQHASEDQARQLTHALLTDTQVRRNAQLVARRHLDLHEHRATTLRAALVRAGSTRSAQLAQAAN
jgi:UDP:flavonoid glycosyltransferase YjiC (YdhE family)